MNVQEGDQVRITQRLMRQGKGTAPERFYQVTGTVEQIRPTKINSWHARRHQGQLHVLELLIRKADDERSSVVIDPGTEVEVLPGADPQKPSASPAQSE